MHTHTCAHALITQDLCTYRDMYTHTYTHAYTHTQRNREGRKRRRKADGKEERNYQDVFSRPLDGKIIST